MIVATSLLAASASPLAALAEPSATDKASARDFMRDGKELRAKGDHPGALKKFQAAYALFPSPITGLALAQELAATGKLVEARETLGDVERMPPKPNESDEGRKAREEASTLRAELLARIPTLEVTLKGVPAGKTATVTIDGASTPAVAAEQGVRVNPGMRAVAARVDAEERTRSVELKEGQRAKLELDLTPASAPKPVEREKPAEPAKPAKPIEPARPAEPARPVDVAGGGGAQRWIGITALGVGVVGVGVGGFLAIKGNADFNDPGDDAGVCGADCQSRQASARSSFRAGALILGIGAAVAVTGVVLWLGAPDGSKGSATQVGVTPGGLTFRTTF